MEFRPPNQISWIGFEKICIGKKVINLSKIFPISGPLCDIFIVPMALRRDFYSMLVFYFEEGL